MRICVVVLMQLKDVLHRQATVEAFTEWLDATLNQRVLKVTYLRIKYSRLQLNVLQSQFVSFFKKRVFVYTITCQIIHVM